MTKLFLYLSLFSVVSFCNTFSFAQDIAVSTKPVDFPHEQIYIHYNNSFLLTGEYFYYSVFCLNNENKMSSKISGIAYVELIAESGKTIFKHKVKLKEGHGQGDFFIPTAVPSGNYKLFGYTQFMRNNNQKTYFQSDLCIVNPYTNQQKALRKDTIENVSNTNIITSYNKEKLNNSYLQINKEVFGKRERVELNINELFMKYGYGSYSILVKKRMPFQIPKNKKSIDLKPINYDDLVTILDFNKELDYLPEMRGELITGRVVKIGGDIGIPNIRIAVSIPGKDYDFKITTTNKKGVFYFNLNKQYDGTEVIFHTLSDIDYEIQLKEQPSLDVSDIIFNKFFLNANMKNTIVERSIHNQIENNYFAFKPDSITTSEKLNYFYGNLGDIYQLDEYTRFATIKETVVEILKDVSIVRKKNKRIIQISPKYFASKAQGFPPLIILDGLFITNHEDFLDLDARRIKRINVITDKYVIGNQSFQGVLDVVSYDNDFPIINTESSSQLRFDLYKPLPKKNYFNQTYNKDALTADKVPDYRHQLLWNPKIKLDEKNQIIEFFTSDVSGDFEISIEGFSKNGIPISVKDFFKVN